jgi:cleavage and polyadenylation specificity factor subunit 3
MQELLLMLDEHWSRHPDLQHIKVYQASGVARKALSVFQTYVGMMNSAIQEAVQVRQSGMQYSHTQKGGKLLTAACDPGELSNRQVLCRPFAPCALEFCPHPSQQQNMPAKRADVLHVLPVLCRLSLLQYRNPFQFKHVSVLGAGMQFQDVEPCVMLATPSMLQSGFSRELFEAWAGDKRNTVLIVDFAVQGTLARQLLDSPQTVTTKDNRPVG